MCSTRPQNEPGGGKASRKENLISKTAFLEYLLCPKNAWLHLHEPKLAECFKLTEYEEMLSKAGQAVEEQAQKLFPKGTLVKTFGNAGIEETKKHIVQKTPVLFQPTFAHKNFIARSDILEYDPEAGTWNLYEIKASNSAEKRSGGTDYIADAAFQMEIIRQNGIKPGKISIIHLNPDYARNEKLDAESLFIIEDITRRVEERKKEIGAFMKEACRDLLKKNCKGIRCDCLYRGRSAHCPTFSYSHPEVPEYSVHDLWRIGNSKNKLKELADRKIYNIKKLPENFPANNIQQNQISVWKTGLPIINAEAIREELSGLEYPLYFLDYETYAPSIPLFRGFRPYEQIPFQFSLDVLEKKGDELENHEYLHDSPCDPSPYIAEELHRVIGKQGTVIVWNKRFEQNINKELGERLPNFRRFFEKVNERIYDLMDIFQDQYYVHPDFHGKTSIKKVLPALLPGLSYKGMGIREGAAASEKWHSMVFGNLLPFEREKILNDLILYCGLDSRAMYEIWRFLEAV